MWIQDVDGDLINLNMVAGIIVRKNNPWDDKDERWRVVASTGTSNPEQDVVFSTLFVGPDKGECDTFINTLVFALGEKVIRF